ncbi:MAG: 1-acyl-sn-glycerol-3-phosphate acyltransferase, partial [Leptotrichiaceae bacterium]
LIGTYDVQSRKSLRVKSNKNIKMIINKPIDTSNLSNEEKKSIDERVRSVVVSSFEQYKSN